MRRLWDHQFRRTTLVLIASVALLVGVALAHQDQLLQSRGYLLSLLPLLWLLRVRSIWTVCWLVLLMGGIGWQRGSEFVVKKQAYQPLYGQKLTLMVSALNDAAYGSRSQFSFDAGKIQLANGQVMAGKLQVSGFGANAVYQGDELQISGKLTPSTGAYQGRVSFATLRVIKHHPSIIASLRRKFAAGMQTALPEPLAPFAMGLLIGQRSNLPAATKQDLLMVGLTHIIAVSGYNLTIMLGASQRLAGKRSKRLTTSLTFILMGLFLLMTGASASIVRAAIVSTLSIVAGYYGRSFKPLNLIALAAAITAWANPFYIWGDASWYLSFLAFFGVLVLAPLLIGHFHPAWQQSLVIMVAVESLCAEVMTMPFVLYTFGQISFIGLPANVLVVTLIPLAMLLSLVAGLGGMLAGSLAGWLAWPARLILTYMLDIAHLLASVPRSFAQKIGFTVWQMIGVYLMVLLMTLGLYVKTKRANYAKITDINVITEGVSGVSGHSKWSTIKRQKGVKDAARGAIFTRLGNAIAIAARHGSDPETNFALRLAMDKAKAANMPAANIQRAIDRIKDKDAAQLHEVLYEGYGPGGTAILVECATDNINRTYPEVKLAFSKHGGNIAEKGAVAFQFDHKGIIRVTSVGDEVLMQALEAGAEDIQEEDGESLIYTDPKDLARIRTALTAAGLKIVEAELTYVPNVTVDVTDIDTAAKIMRLMEALDEIDDVTNTHVNFDIDVPE